jgi:hypothetical protein
MNTLWNFIKEGFNAALTFILLMFAVIIGLLALKFILIPYIIVPLILQFFPGLG